MVNPMDLTGKHILVTGGSSGIGRATAIQASRLGARVTLVARREEELKKTLAGMERPGEHAYHAFDLSQVEKIDGLVKRLVAERGAFDGLCHAAGVGPSYPLKLTKPSYTADVFSINTFSFIELVRCLSLKKNLNPGASLVGISSLAGERGTSGQTAYSASKGAMDAALGPMAAELGRRPEKIRINNVAFTWIKTELYDKYLELAGEDAEKKIHRNQYLGFIDLEHAANINLFLISGMAKYITGTVVRVYAGL